VGGEPALAVLGAMANEARHLLVGFASGTWANPDPHAVAIGNYSLVGVYVGAYGKDELDEIHDLVLDRFSVGALPSIVTRTIELGELAEAIEDLEQRSAMGKTVVTIGD
ncbi:MAG: zinc-binding dehydrogenase, partial [Acidimicrobiia bacterium]|nr:zinc-binding dehydrogenase [Acidimicrobiia bacterium]